MNDCIVRGIKLLNFTTKDGNTINGFHIYVGTEIRADEGTGEEFDRYFISKKDYVDLGFELTVGLSVTLLFDKHGKLCKIIPAEID